ncbi:uncharacterized protein [Miscanthus floridulus]|uniref:uncharacterized protein n=1 Tax=Miscanthus floridulus TaxID=154761 RepID=UPI00345876CB
MHFEPLASRKRVIRAGVGADDCATHLAAAEAAAAAETARQAAAVGQAAVAAVAALRAEMEREESEPAGGGNAMSMLTKSNYHKWSLLMKVKLLARWLWEAVHVGGVNYDDDRRALEALCTAIPTELGASIANKATAKLAWESIAAARVGGDRMARNGDTDLTEERAVEKFLCCMLRKYAQIVMSIETLLDFEQLTVEDVTGRLKGEAKEGVKGPSFPLFASASSAHLHLNELCAHAFLSKGADDDKIDGWYLNTYAMHHMTGWREFFSELDSDVKGSVKFGDASVVEIKGVSSIIFKVETGEHRLLTGMYDIPALRKSIISVGQLDENGSWVEIEDSVVHPLSLVVHWDDEAWRWHERFGHLHFEALKQLSKEEMVHGMPCVDHVEQLCDTCVVTKLKR